MRKKIGISCTKVAALALLIAQILVK